MATVAELSEPYRNHLVAPLPRGPGVCATCWRAIAPEYHRCLQCQDAYDRFGDRLADVVVPIAIAVKREQLAHELWHYKYDEDARVREWLEVRLAAVLWRFLAIHEPCVARGCGSDGFPLVTTVPGTRSGGAEHPLVRIVGSTVGQTNRRFERLLERDERCQDDSRSVRDDRYRSLHALSTRPDVLLIDDTWTTGSRAQSAAIALHAAGAARVAVVVIGRHFDRFFGSGDTYYSEAKRWPFNWDSCCLDR